MRVALRVLAAAILVTVPLIAGPASAHTKLVDSSPPEGSTLGGIPVTIELRFSENINKHAAVVFTAPHARQIALGAVQVSGSRVTVKVKGKPKGSGDYTIAYRVVAKDGHPVVGRVDFSVGGPGAGDGGGFSLGLPVMIAILVGCVGLGAVGSVGWARRKNAS